MQLFLTYFLGCLAATTFLAVPNLGSQTASISTLVLTKEDAVDFALRNNKLLKAARTTFDQAMGRYRQSGRLNNPELKIEYATDKTFNSEGEYTFGIGFEQRFPITKRLSLLKNIAKIEIMVAEKEIANQERLLTQAIETAILNVAQAEEQLRLRRSQVRLNEDFADFVESRVLAGEASTIEVNQVKLELFSVKQEIQQLTIKRNDELDQLKRLLGVEPETSIELLYDFKIPDNAAELPIITHSTLENHPEYQLKKLLFEIADKQTSLAMANRWDDLAVGMFFENEKSVDFPIGRETDNFIGVSVSIPLPFNKRNHGEIEASRAYKRQVELELEALSLEKRSIAKTLTKKVLDLYQQAFEYDTGVTQIVEQNLRDMNMAYESGLINLTDLFRSQEQRLKIEFLQLTILHDYEQALVDWKAATYQETNPS